ncbi:MAG: hypothetical protein KC417_05915 [Myxococcales bacterium]|nr:hypothetical protein [Myxococcales bacterium]
MGTLDPRFLAVLDEVARTELGALDATGDALATQVRTLSERYTRDRDAIDHAAGTDVRAARFRFFLPRDFLKIHWPLEELAAWGRLPTKRTWRVLDLGAGYGATGLGLAHFAATRGVERIELVAVDRDVAALRCLTALAERSVEAGLVPIDLRAVAGNAAHPPVAGSAPFDFVLWGFVLNEMPTEGADATAHRADMLARTLAAHAPAGHGIVLEPALKHQSRALQAVRDVFAARRGPVRVVAPCTHAAPCPMLAGDRDWCHEDVPVELPPALATTAEAAGLRQAGLTYSYLTLGAAPEPHHADDLRIVSAPLASKGKTESWACGASGLKRLVRLDRHRDRAGVDGDAIDRARRGAILRLDGVDRETAGERIRVEPPIASVDVLKPPGPSR